MFCTWEDGKKYAVLRLRIGDVQQTVAWMELDREEKGILEVASDRERYRFYAVHRGKIHEMGSAGTKYLSSEVAGGFTGVFMGLYAVDREERWGCISELRWIQRQNHYWEKIT